MRRHEVSTDEALTLLLEELRVYDDVARQEAERADLERPLWVLDGHP